jgi:hypothetical protein
MSIKRIGLISGSGELPHVIALKARRMGLHVTAIILSPLDNKKLRSVADEAHRIHIGHLAGLISLLRDSGIEDVVMAGKVPKDMLFRGNNGISPDPLARRLLGSLKDLSDDTIMKALIGELEQNGIRVMKTTLFTNELITEEGILTHRRPERREWMDIRFGWDIARKIGGLQIGQTVVVKDRAVVAIEAIEGTDQTIKRGGTLAGEGAVVVKLSRPGQDMRYDVPVVGMKTLNMMKRVRASALALEARRCIILDKDRFIKRADEEGISVIGISKRMVSQD